VRRPETSGQSLSKPPPPGGPTPDEGPTGPGGRLAAGPPAPHVDGPGPGLARQTPPTAAPLPPPPGRPEPPAHPPEPTAPQPVRRRSRTPLLLLVAGLLTAGLIGSVIWADSGGGSASSSGPVTTAPTGTAAGNPPPGAPPATTGPTGPPGPTPTGIGSGPASPSPAADPARAKAQATALDDLLSRSADMRQPVGNEVAKVQSCPGAAVTRHSAQVFDQDARQHDQLLAALAGLDLSQLDGGPAAADLLRDSWQLSARADRSYAAWARTLIAEGCGQPGAAPRTPDLVQADAVSARSKRSALDFAVRWEPIADRYGLAPRTGDRI
jgi:hypothetical protein